jgi:hypothetical protein
VALIEKGGPQLTPVVISPFKALESSHPRSASGKVTELLKSDAQADGTKPSPGPMNRAPSSGPRASMHAHPPQSCCDGLTATGTRTPPIPHIRLSPPLRCHQKALVARSSRRKVSKSAFDSRAFSVNCILIDLSGKRFDSGGKRCNIANIHHKAGGRKVD